MDARTVETIDDYIRGFPKDVQAVLRKLRQIIKEAAPRTTERISYRIPTFDLDGRYLVYYAAFKNHVSVYPATTSAVEKVKGLSAYKVSTGTLRFPLDHDIPYDMIKRFVRFRAAEQTASAKKTTRIARPLAGGKRRARQ